jgi:hypothetical protein
MNPSDKLQTDIDFFFDPPHKDPSEHTLNGQQSVLYHLRRELQLCLFPRDPIVDESALKSKLKSRAPCTRFTPILLVVSGIDLLGKFLAGTDEDKVRCRFTDYLRQHFSGLTENDIDVIWRVRNSYVHSFGLHDIKKNNKEIGVYPGCFVGQIITPHTDKPFDFAVNVADLCVEFLESLKSYKGALRGDGNLQKNFAKMFPKYGFFGTT